LQDAGTASGVKPIMRRFTSARHLKRFVFIHDLIANRRMMLAKPQSERVR
jgi:hypothetical protein